MSARFSFFSTCSCIENFFSVILLFVGRFTYHLSNSWSYRNKLLVTWTTVDVFINLNLSRVTPKLISKMCFFTPCLCQVSSSSRCNPFNWRLFWNIIFYSVERKGYIAEVRLLWFSFYGASHWDIIMVCQLSVYVALQGQTELQRVYFMYVSCKCCPITLQSFYCFTITQLRVS